MARLGFVKHTERGFELVQWEDIYGCLCDLQQSSVILDDGMLNRPGESAVWLGLNDDRMHLNRTQVAALIAHLQTWLDKGTFSIEG